MDERIIVTDKDAHFAEVMLGVIDRVERPIILFEGEKEAVRKGLKLLLNRYFFSGEQMLEEAAESVNADTLMPAT